MVKVYTTSVKNPDGSTSFRSSITPPNKDPQAQKLIARGGSTRVEGGVVPQVKEIKGYPVGTIIKKDGSVILPPGYKEVTKTEPIDTRNVSYGQILSVGAKNIQEYKGIMEKKGVKTFDSTGQGVTLGVKRNNGVMTDSFVQATPPSDKTKNFIQNLTGRGLASTQSNYNRGVNYFIENKMPYFDVTNPFGKYQKDLYFERQKLKQDVVDKRINPFVATGFSFGQGVVSGLAGVGGLGYDVIFDPGKVGKGVQTIISNPGGVVENIAKSFQKDPVFTAGEFAGSYGAFKVAGSGVKVAQSGLTKVSSIGKTYIPSTKLVVPEVASGKVLFPTAKGAGDALKKFNSEAYKQATGKTAVYSATDYTFTPFVGRNINITSGRGLVKSVDVPGLYTSSRGVSTYFLRLEQKASQYSLLPKSFLPKQSKILAVEGSPKLIPKNYSSSLEKAQSFFGKEGLRLTAPKGKPGTPYFSPALTFGLKNEAEAVVQVGSRLERVGLNTPWEKLTGFSKYTKINGKNIPIYEYKAAGSSPVLSKSVDVSKYASSSSGFTEKALVSYAGVGSSGVFGLSKASIIDANSYEASVPSSSVINLVPSSVVKSSLNNIVSEPSISQVSSVKSFVKESLKEPYKSSRSSGKRGGGSGYVPSVSSSSGVVIVPDSYKPSGGSRLVSQLKQSYVSKKSFSYSTPSYKIPKVNYSIPSFKPSKSLSLGSSTKLFNLKPAYDVFSRVRGKAVKIGVGLPKNLAIKVGTSFTDKTPARSFVVKLKGFTSKNDVPLLNISNRYRPPKPLGRVAMEGFRLVEKSKFLIDTPGEFEGITLKGVRAKRRKKKK